MIAVHRVNVWVHDQQTACEFWTGKVGFELRADATFPELGGFRWLAVGPPGGSGPGEPVTGSAAELVLALSGRRGGAVLAR